MSDCLSVCNNVCLPQDMASAHFTKAMQLLLRDSVVVSGVNIDENDDEDDDDDDNDDFSKNDSEGRNSRFFLIFSFSIKLALLAKVKSCATCRVPLWCEGTDQLLIWTELK